MKKLIVTITGPSCAGKSTLAKMMAGVYTADSGTMEFNGSEVSFRSPFEALRTGVAMMAQEIMLVPDATVIENVFLGSTPRLGIFPNRSKMRSDFKELLELTREARVSAIAPSSFKIITAKRPEFAGFFQERKDKGATNAAILDEWMGNPENHSTTMDYLKGTGESVVEGLGGLVLYPLALAGSGIRSPFSYALSASLRPQNQIRPTTNTASTVSVLAMK